MRKLFAFFAAFLAIAALSTPAQAQWGGKKDFIYEKGGYAIDGRDTVAYFNLDATDLKDDGLPNPKSVKGDPQFSYDYEGATWIFASQDNLDRFKADPAKYVPAYNGYCAFAAAKGSLAKTDPDAWRVVDGRLFLNFSSSVQRRWVKDIPGHISAADTNFETKLKGQLATPEAS